MVREFAVEVEWVPFELHPDTPPEGRVRETAQRSTSSGVGSGVREHLRALAEEAGLPMQANTVSANAHKSLEAAEWARDQGREVFEQVHAALFRAYFGEARNISTTDQVVAALAPLGLETASLRAALAEGRYSERVDEYTRLARENGISSTPTFILEDRYVVRGAQEYAVFEDVLTRLGVPRRATPPPPA